MYESDKEYTKAVRDYHTVKEINPQYPNIDSLINNA